LQDDLHDDERMKLIRELGSKLHLTAEVVNDSDGGEL
jgi:hypothetical protein